MPHPRLATLIDRLHVAVIVFWLVGFAFYWHFPTFRHYHAWFVVLGGAHQLMLCNRCISTIVSNKLRGPKPDTKEEAFVAQALKRMGIKWTNRHSTFVTALTFAAAVLSLIFWK